LASDIKKNLTQMSTVLATSH